jgi:hypothetical protein
VQPIFSTLRAHHKKWDFFSDKFYKKPTISDKILTAGLSGFRGKRVSPLTQSFIFDNSYKSIK